MRLLKILTITLALSSTIAFVLASRTTARPLTTISAVQPAMNYAYVRIEGRVPDFPVLGDGSLTFRVLDDSGDMRVVAYRSAAEALTASQRIPMPGDLVAVEGTLRIRDDEPSLIVNAPEALTIESLDATPVRLAALDALQVGERAQVLGQVRRIRDVNESLRIVTLRDGNAMADIVLPLNLPAFREATALTTLVEGEWLRVSGGVGEFRGAKQLLPFSGAAIERAQRSDDDQLRPIGALDKGFVGQWVTVQGVVDDLRPFKQGMRVVLRDADATGDDAGEQTIMIVAFDRAWQTTPFSQTLVPGDLLRVQGEVQEYRGELEIIPELGVDLEQSVLQ